MRKVFVSRALPPEILQPIRELAELDVWPEDSPPPYPALMERVGDVDGLLCLLTDRIDSQLLEHAPKLRVVSQMAVGYDNIDVRSCTARGIPVGNTPGVLTETTADLAFGLLLAVARRIVEADAFTRSGEWRTWSPMLLAGQDVHHASLGIVGMGRIGYAMAQRAAGFDMRILYTHPRAHEEAERKLGARRMPLESLLAESDFVSLHVPLTPQTHKLIGAEQLDLMKPAGILINTTRGPVVDQAALIEALQAGRIKGAGLDVYEKEPLPADDPLLSLPNVVALPHIGSASISTRTLMAEIAVQNLAAGLEGHPLLHCVNPESLS